MSYVCVCVCGCVCLCLCVQGPSNYWLFVERSFSTPKYLHAQSTPWEENIPISLCQFHLCSTPSAIYQVHFVPVCLLFCVGARVGHCRPVPTIDQWSMSLLSVFTHAARAVDRLQHGQAHRLHLLTPKDCFIGVFRARFQHPGIGSGVWTLRWRGP